MVPKLWLGTRVLVFVGGGPHPQSSGGGRPFRNGSARRGNPPLRKEQARALVSAWQAVGSKSLSQVKVAAELSSAFSDLACTWATGPLSQLQEERRAYPYFALRKLHF